MALAKVEVDLPSLSGLVSSLETDEASMEQLFQQMYESVLELNNMWTGQAAVTFQATAMADYEVILELNNSIKQLLDQYRNACKEYAYCEQAVEAAVSAIRV